MIDMLYHKKIDLRAICLMKAPRQHLRQHLHAAKSYLAAAPREVLADTTLPEVLVDTTLRGERSGSKYGPGASVGGGRRPTDASTVAVPKRAGADMPSSSETAAGVLNTLPGSVSVPHPKWCIRGRDRLAIATIGLLGTPARRTVCLLPRREMRGKATVFGLRATIGNPTAAIDTGGRRQHLATAPQRKEVSPWPLL